MFGKNEVVGKKLFANQKDTLTITSVFFTLQGEGPLSGVPSVFVRLAKCNLTCSFCDTYFDSGEEYTYPELVEKIEQAIESFFVAQNMERPDWTRSHILAPREIALVITGGEPLLQADSLARFLNHVQHYSTAFSMLQFETNGILPWNHEVDERLLIVCSPKASEVKGKPVRHITPHKTILEKATCLKFVIQAPLPVKIDEGEYSIDMSNPYSDIPGWALAWKEDNDKEIYLSPMNEYQSEPRAALEAAKSNLKVSLEERSEVLERISFWEIGLLDMERNQLNHEYTALLAMRHGCRLSLQTHLLASLP